MLVRCCGVKSLFSSCFRVTVVARKQSSQAGCRMFLSPPLLLFISLYASSCLFQCVGEEIWVDSRTVYIGHKEPPPGAEAYIPQRYPDNRIVSSKVSEPQLITHSPSVAVALPDCLLSYWAAFLKDDSSFQTASSHFRDHNHAAALSHSIPCGTSSPRICLSSSEE